MYSVNVVKMVVGWVALAVAVLLFHIFHGGCGYQQPIFGIYRQKNVLFYLKFLFVYAAIQLRKGRSSKGSSTTGYGVKLKDREEDIDTVQTLPDGAPQAADAVYFVGASRDEYYFVGATARRPNGVVNAFWHLRIPGLGLLEAPKLPDTTYVTDGKDYRADGLHIEPVKAMKVWRITHDGPMRLKNESFNVKFDLKFETQLPHFDFDSDIPTAAIARAIALEPWSRSYFERIKTSHQTHHEQMGTLSGKVEVEGHGQYQLKLDCMRDHSFAMKRDWKLMHRYGLHSVHVEDGTRFNVGIISHPDIFSNFEMGYLYTPNGQLFGVDSCDLQLWRHGEGGKPPTDYAFNFRAGGKSYRVECQVIESPELFLGHEWEAKIVERMCKYKVNGKAAWGFAEWEYRHHGGRPLQLST